MPLEVVMPKLGLTMTEGLIVEWKKKEGEPVRKGEVLFVLETEKVTYEVEAAEDGVLGRILIHENETVPVGAAVAYLLLPGEDASALEELKEREVTAPAQPTVSTPERPVSESIPLPQKGGRAKASPLAKKTARKYHVDLETIRGTGPSGMVIQADVENARQSGIQAVSGKAPETGDQVSHSGMRRAIARNMIAAKVETAQTYMSNTIDAGKIVQHREDVLQKIQDTEGVRVTITDLMMKITGAAISRHPVLNTRWTDQGVVYLPEVHMGMAMALEDGLIVPVIRDINRKSLAEIAKDRITLIQKGKSKGFLPDDISGSTFTLSAMGMFGTEWFTANINVPESAILAVGAIMDLSLIHI